MKRLPLYLKIIIGLFLGILWAVLSSLYGWSQFTLDWLNPFGNIFINLLKLIAVPLVLFSIIKGISGLSNIRRLGRLGAKTLFAYLLTTVFAISIGLTLVNIFQPGTLAGESQRLENRKSYERFVASRDGVELKDDKQLLSDSAWQEANALSTNQADPEIMDKLKTAEETREKGPLSFLVDIVPGNIFVSLTDNSLMLQVIFFALFFGVTLILIPSEKAKPVIDFVDGSNEVFLKMVDIVMMGAPFFVFALMAGKIVEMAGDDLGSMVEIFKSLGGYVLTVIAGLVIVAFIIYPALVALFVRKINIIRFFKGISPAQLLAFSTSSSAATLPVTMDCVRDNLGVSKEVTSFVLPIGATVNMDGTSLYQAVAVVFLAQLHMVDLTLGQQLTIVLTATLASIGSAAVPSAGLVMLILVLSSVGLDPTWIAIILPVDRILDMCRTVVNVTGDATVSSIVGETESAIEPPKQQI